MAGEHVLTYGAARIPYLVREAPDRSTRIAIHVDPDGSVLVDAPPGHSAELIQKAVRKRARWIATHVQDARERYRHVREREYVSGEQILYLGRRYVLKVLAGDDRRAPPKLRGNRLETAVISPDRDEVRGRVRAWYRTRAQEYFSRRLRELAAELPWVDAKPPFRLLEMKRQWGSCSAKGEIILNPHLIKAPRDCVDYVLIHELAHLKHHDHGLEFQRILERHVPNWRSTKRGLDGLVELVTKD